MGKLPFHRGHTHDELQGWHVPRHSVQITLACPTVLREPPTSILDYQQSPTYFSFVTLRHFKTVEKRDAGYTLIELMELIAAIASGAFVADKVARHFQGIWHTIVYWSIATVGSGIFFLFFLYSFGYLFHFLDRRKKQTASSKEGSGNAS